MVAMLPEELLTHVPHREYFVGYSEDCKYHRLHTVAEGQTTALGVVNTISSAHKSSSDSDSDPFGGLSSERGVQHLSDKCPSPTFVQLSLKISVIVMHQH
eukprot:12589319-Ditylum_brightwellii.AAC.1